MGPFLPANLLLPKVHVEGLFLLPDTRPYDSETAVAHISSARELAAQRPHNWLAARYASCATTASPPASLWRTSADGAFKEMAHAQLEEQLCSSCRQASHAILEGLTLTQGHTE